MTEEKMNRWGIGPVFALLSFGYGMMTIAISRYFHPAFQMGFVPYWLSSILGIALIIIGVPFLIVSLKTVMRAYAAHELVTKGIYRCCRHPVYASWVFFIGPGIALLIYSWIALSAPIFMYLILVRLVRKEEVDMENVFGSEYREYKKKVPCLLPAGWIKSVL